MARGLLDWFNNDDDALPPLFASADPQQDANWRYQLPMPPKQRLLPLRDQW